MSEFTAGQRVRIHARGGHQVHKDWDQCEGVIDCAGGRPSEWHLKGVKHPETGMPLTLLIPEDNLELIDSPKGLIRAAVDFKGEARCNFSNLKSVLDGCPLEPWFGVDHPRTQQSFAKIKRHLSTNLKDWPVCRHRDEPAQLVFDARWLRDGSALDSEYCLPRFTCACFGGRRPPKHFGWSPTVDS